MWKRPDHVLACDLRALERLQARRRVLRLLGGTGLLPFVGCRASGSSASTVAEGGSETLARADACATIPEETAGPFPGDGSNGQNALALTGIVRSDIRRSFAGPTGVAEGVPLTFTLTLLERARGCAPVLGRAVYVWHCDRNGDYSMYTGAATTENYLRGVQQSNALGEVTFTTIFPACYPGRWPHVHFEVYASLAAVTAGENALRTSQLAFPRGFCERAYAQAGYTSSVAHLAALDLASDTVFGDGADLQMAAVAGNPATGFSANLSLAL